MATNFPGSLDTYTDLDCDSTENPKDVVNNLQDAVEALEAKVGANGSAVTTSHDYKLSGVTGTDKAASLTGTETLTNKTLIDNSTTFADNADTTKRMQFQLSTVSAGTTRTLTVPNDDAVIVGDDTTQTLSNKTILYSATNYVTVSGPQGFGSEYAIVPSVASNNLTVALKLLDGTTNPSSAKPLQFRIFNAVRNIPAALSFTKNAGTNWLELGNAETAAKGVDLFVYVGWDSANSLVRLGMSRIPYAKTYSDFNASTTDDHGSVWDTAPGANDNVEVIGRVRLILSGTPSFNWSLPATSNIINRPVWRSDRIVYQPVFTGFTATVPTGDFFYYVDGEFCYLTSDPTANGTSNATGFTMTAAMKAGTVPAFTGAVIWDARDNGVALTVAARAFITGGTRTIDLFTNMSNGTWSNANGKRARFLFQYQLKSS